MAILSCVHSWLRQAVPFTYSQSPLTRPFLIHLFRSTPPVDQPVTAPELAGRPGDMGPIKVLREHPIAAPVVALLYTFVTAFSLPFSLHIVTGYITADLTTWEKVLPGMNELWLPAFGMYIHWLGGVVILVVGTVQLFPFTRRKGSTMPLHRILGTLYIAAALMTSLGGNLFIYTTSQGCVGGPNMTVAFSIAGWVMFFLACATYYFARRGDATRHRDFAIRLWGQGVASLLYRMWYMLLGILFGYPSGRSLGDYHRPLDEALDWWFFVPNLIVTEIVVWWLHRRDSSASQADAAGTQAANSGGDEGVPLLE
eukprot:CAMPEP_0117654824 /NCGR_PEP_ID=MMETSP0804-20121206/3952_1 /TAXON_ID=1074897 /ORGANISM="Tetraselmis astigmatica, Strain CCMP880" /LENGTH=311 /DNA_ID=CAMNT_0005461135 /DNA_START=306 /DNA_END=1238 /DNA_ORIENTATION=+